MTLDFDAHLATESDAFLEAVLAADPDARVPGCPDWTADDLLWHLGGQVQSFWAYVLRTRPNPPEDWSEAERPADRDGLVAAYRAASADLREQLAGIPDDEPVWTWHHSNHTVGFIRRRQAHEALIHRVDAEQAAGRLSSLDPALAADGVAECIDWMYAGAPDWGRFTPSGERVALECTDTEVRVLIGLGRFTGTEPESGTERDEPDVEFLGTDSTEPADAVVRGTAGDIDLWLWHRGPLETLDVSGDQAAFATLRTILGHPLN